MVDASLVNLVEKAAEARDDPVVPREHIVKVLGDIDNGACEVERYPTGLPTLRGVYELALGLSFL